MESKVPTWCDEGQGELAAVRLVSVANKWLRAVLLCDMSLEKIARFYKLDHNWDLVKCLGNKSATWHFVLT